MSHGGKQYLIVQRDNTDATFEGAEDFVIRIDAFVGTLDSTDILIS